MNTVHKCIFGFEQQLIVPLEFHAVLVCFQQGCVDVSDAEHLRFLIDDQTLVFCSLLLKLSFGTGELFPL